MHPASGHEIHTVSGFPTPRSRRSRSRKTLTFPCAHLTPRRIPLTHSRCASPRPVAFLTFPTAPSPSHTRCSRDRAGWSFTSKKLTTATVAEASTQPPLPRASSPRKRVTSRRLLNRATRRSTWRAPKLLPSPRWSSLLPGAHEGAAIHSDSVTGKRASQHEPLAQNLSDPPDGANPAESSKSAPEQLPPPETVVSHSAVQGVSSALAIFKALLHR